MQVFTRSRTRYQSSAALALSLLLGACGDSAPATPNNATTPAAAPKPMVVQTITEASGSAAAVVAGIAELPTYQRISGVAGNLSSTGSDTLANLMTLWTESFKREYPSVNIQVQAAGSSTAPPALTEGTSNFGPMSRAMKDKEIEAFEARHGYKPTAIRVAIDALAVYVHKDNPIDAMSIAQVDSIFSVTRRCGGNADSSSLGSNRA